MTEWVDVCSQEQRRRAALIIVARQVLGDDAQQVSAFDLVYVTTYLENGGGCDQPEPKPEPEPDRTPCPFDPHHLLSSHWPGGAWYGTDPETHKKFSLTLP